jgi:uncharacterized integral membrane protein
MVQIVLNIIFLLILATLIVFNIGKTTDINLFGYVFPNVSVVVVAFLSFILGILYAFAYFVCGRIKKKFGGRKSQTKRDKKKEKESPPDIPPDQGDPPLPPPVIPGI